MFPYNSHLPGWQLNRPRKWSVSFIFNIQMRLQMRYRRRRWWLKLVLLGKKTKKTTNDALRTGRSAQRMADALSFGVMEVEQVSERNEKKQRR